METGQAARPKATIMHEPLIQMIRERAYKQGTFVLSSGKTSSHFVDLSKLTLTPDGLKLVLDTILDKMDIGVWDAVGGPALGATPIVSGMLLRGAKRGFFVRERTKRIGDMIEGEINAGETVLLIDDVVTTGQSLYKAVEAVVQKGARVGKVLTILDREEGGRELMARCDLELESLIKLSDLGGG